MMKKMLVKVTSFQFFSMVYATTESNRPIMIKILSTDFKWTPP